jgi:hypothetical protein
VGPGYNMGAVLISGLVLMFPKPETLRELPYPCPVGESYAKVVLQIMMTQAAACLVCRDLVFYCLFFVRF